MAGRGNRYIQFKRGISFGLAFIAMIPLAYPVTYDHIGPDPIQSESCITITPGRAVMCTGSQIKPEASVPPSVTINCGPGILMLISHRSVPAESSLRQVRLISEDGEFTDQWLAISDTQSAYLVFFEGSPADEYERMIRLIGRLISPESGLFGYSFDEAGIEGLFELDYSDRIMLEQITANC